MKIEIISNILKFMIILLGSGSGHKMEILRGVLEILLETDFEVVVCRADSGITEQPLDLETTMQGAENRARSAVVDYGKAYDFSFGLEAGLVMIGGVYNFVCAVAFIDKDGDVRIGKSDSKPLPEEVSERVIAGEHFGGAIRSYREKENLSVQEKSDALEFVERKKGFTEAILVAWGKSKKNN